MRSVRFAESLILGGAMLLGVFSRLPARATEAGGGRTCRVGSPVEARLFRPGTWDLVGVEAVNATDQPAELLAGVFFDRDPNLHFARKLWVPPRAVRRTTCPIRVLPTIASTRQSAPITVYWGDLSAAAGEHRPPDLQYRRNAILLPIHGERPSTGMIEEIPRHGETEDLAPYRALIAARYCCGRSRRISTMNRSPQLAGVNTMGGLEFILLTSDRIVGDAQALSSLRSWVLRGGCLWVMLDKVEPETVECLLGDAFDAQVVDRVGLTRVQVESAHPERDPGEESPRSFDQPVDFVRVLASRENVLYTVDGWPACFWQGYGRGRVMMTTLGARGWFRARTPRDPRPTGNQEDTPFVATPPLQAVATSFLVSAPPPALGTDQLKPLLSRQIGYRIIARPVVGGVLGGFCLLLLVVGLGLIRGGHLGHIVWIGPATALLAVGVLIGLGTRSRQAVPSTLAEVQHAVTVPGLAEADLSGLIATFNPRANSKPVGSTGGGLFFPDMEQLGGTVRRMVWTDEDAWHWEGLTLPAGVRVAPFQAARALQRPVRLSAAFGPEGLAGSVDAGSFGVFADAVVVVPRRPALAVHVRPDGSFAAGRHDVLAPGQYLADTLLNDQQQRRQQIYRELLARELPVSDTRRPRFLAWAKAIDAGFSFPQADRRIESSLVEIPFVLERSRPGTRVRVPATFLPYRSVPGPDRST